MTSDENPSPALENSTPSPVPAEPPAAALVRDGLGAAEALALRAELEAERKARAAAETGRKSAEFKAAEAERQAQDLKAKRKFATLLNHPWS